MELMRPMSQTGRLYKNTTITPNTITTTTTNTLIIANFKHLLYIRPYVDYFIRTVLSQ